jgi:replication initiator protein RepSA
MFGFTGRYLTKSRSHRVTLQLLCDRRIMFRHTVSSGPDTDGKPAQEPTTLVVNFLQFVGAGWHTTADALLANTSTAMAREHQETAREALYTLAA